MVLFWLEVVFEPIQPPGRDMNAQRGPYEDLAVDGIISYKVVTFVCDREKNQLQGEIEE